MVEYINGREAKTALLEDLLKATKENIETTTEQNKKMGRYTKWIVIMTLTITCFTIVQVIMTLIWRFSG